MNIEECLLRLDSISTSSNLDDVDSSDVVISLSKGLIEKLDNLKSIGLIWNIYKGYDGEICFLLKNPMNINKSVEIIFYENKKNVVFQEYGDYRQTEFDWSKVIEFKDFLTKNV